MTDMDYDSNDVIARIRANETGPVGERVEAQNRKLRARVAELEAERDDALNLSLKRFNRIAELESGAKK